VLVEFFLTCHVKSGTGITTRSKAKSTPDQWVMLPLPTKVIPFFYSSGETDTNVFVNLPYLLCFVVCIAFL